MKTHRDAATRSTAFVAVALLLAACGAQDAGTDAGRAPADRQGGTAAMQAGGAPDSAQAQERLLANANLITPDAARIVSYRETGVRFEGPQQMQSAIVSYEAELEFAADTYFLSDHKAGDRAQVYGEIEYLNEGGAWRLLTMDINPR